MMTAQESLSLCRLLKDPAERLLLRLPETPLPLNPICPLRLQSLSHPDTFAILLFYLPRHAENAFFQGEGCPLGGECFVGAAARGYGPTGRRRPTGHG